MYKAALDYFEKRGKFDKTLQLFEEIAPYYQGTVREDTILFYTADAHSGRVITSSAPWSSTTSGAASDGVLSWRRRNTNTPWVSITSPPANRDQTSTYMAITSINEYLQRYPNSLKKQLCLIRLDELQQTLYDKSFINARTYYKIGRYKSAVVALRNALREYPETPHREEILYLTVKSCYELAANSVHALQTGRYLDMLDAYYTFIPNSPESGYRRELDRLQKTAREYLDKHQSEATE